MHDYEEIYEEDREDYRPDPYFLRARKGIEKLYEKDTDAVYYLRQLQLKQEDNYFHWITYNALVSLQRDGTLKKIVEPVKISNRTIHPHFLAHRANRYPRRKINEMVKIIAELSDNAITWGCGNRAELLFHEGITSRGFASVGKESQEYKGRKWIKTNHNFDYIFEKDGIGYGCEIKNALGYIEKEELEIKLKMCKKLKLRPLFIMRHSPRSYNNMIIKAGGFALIFKAQIFELSQKKLVERIKNILGYEADCPKAIPSGIIDRFDSWHKKHS
ncbi:MAG: hypothetical protein ISS34_01935 [Candidatus Omnitrophica bacterium]|nr:hypothetical protein [Candidatus Omnitrophota bacterium]